MVKIYYHSFDKDKIKITTK